LVGADPDWRPITERTTEIYSALPSGKYTFKVRASNSEGTWNSAPISFSFRIAAPFYKRPWFIILSVVLGLIIIFSYIKVREKSLIREKQVLEEKVAQRTAEISVKNIELARKNKDITDSIRYAKRIQNALFPSEHPFQNMFILYKPKDIVSGDFYWATELNGHEMLASVDCTGHGVPGAFMSIIGFNSLNKIVKEMGITRPADILHKLDLEVVKALQQKEGEVVQDGMDISLICFDREKFELQYAGAYNSLYLVRNGELMEYKASKIAIGQNIIGRNKEFENHTIKLEDGDTIYLFSDGFADQQGGDKGRKFMTRSFKERLTLLNNYPIDKQRDMLIETLAAWQGNYEQIDDILVIGRKFTKG
jgi:serine phosphatase RsbU (regulator of sigma subunit)